MGRMFSTTYRAFMVAFSISALVLSFMSATSCSFLSFDHQYESQNRWLQAEGTTEEGAAPPGETIASLNEQTDALISQMNDESSIPVDPVDPVDPEGEDFPPVSVTVTGGADEGGAAMNDPEDLEMNTDMDMEMDNMYADEKDKGTDMDELETDPIEIDMTENLPTQPVDVFGEGPDKAMEETVAPEGGLSGPISSTLGGMDEAVDLPDSVTDAMTDAFAPSESGLAEPQTPSSGSPAREPTPSFGANGADSTATAPTEPDLVVSGEAGLYCSGETQFDIRSFWGGSVDKTIDELESEIDLESSDDLSEEVARNAVLASAVFGTLLSFIVVLGSAIGRRMCFERFIIGIIAFCALICQSVTFLFFDSKRYCNGDIVNEILNQVPCVMGRGGVYSAVSVALYAVIMMMASRLPHDDPYGVCCNKKGKSTEGSAPLSQDDGGTGAASNGRSWVSKEREGALEEQEGANEII